MTWWGRILLALHILIIVWAIAYFGPWRVRAYSRPEVIPIGNACVYVNDQGGLAALLLGAVGGRCF